MDEKSNTIDWKSYSEMMQNFIVEPKDHWTKRELYVMAEKFYSGEINARQVASIVLNYSDFKKLKEIIQFRMKATADALCDVLDKAAFNAE